MTPDIERINSPEFRQKLKEAPFPDTQPVVPQKHDRLEPSPGGGYAFSSFISLLLGVLVLLYYWLIYDAGDIERIHSRQNGVIFGVGMLVLSALQTIVAKLEVLCAARKG